MQEAQAVTRVDGLVYGRATVRRDLSEVVHKVNCHDDFV